MAVTVSKPVFAMLADDFCGGTGNALLAIGRASTEAEAASVLVEHIQAETKSGVCNCTWDEWMRGERICAGYLENWQTTGNESFVKQRIAGAIERDPGAFVEIDDFKFNPAWMGKTDILFVGYFMQI